MKAAFSGKTGTIITHVIMWCLLGTFTLLWQPLSWRMNIPQEFWYKQAVLFIFMLVMFYANTKFFVPKLLNDNKVTWFVILNVVMALSVGFIIEQIEIRFDLREQMNRAFRAAREIGIVKREEIVDYFSVLISLIVLGMSTIISTVQTWQYNRRVQMEQEKERVQSELSYLRAQINPHFFFNTLNNIYALTQINNEAAGEAVHKLSQMMRYVLYETPQDKVALSKEIAFIQNYVELMRLRLTSNVEVNMSTPSQIKEVTIAPMLVLPFIENAFKHGVSTTQKSKIDIQIEQNQNQISLQIINTLFNEKYVNLEESNGIGLINTRRRLDLLYPGQYELTVCEKSENCEFYVLLTLQTT